MRSYHTMMWAIALIAGIAIIGPSAGSASAQDAKLEAVPAQAALSPALIKEPVGFKGSGFGAKEVVMVEMILPQGVKVKAVPDGESVGLAFGETDEKGDFDVKMLPTATLNWFFQVAWTPEGKPDLQQASPLPPGKYDLQATGMTSGKVVKATLELQKPPPPPPAEEKK